MARKKKEARSPGEIQAQMEQVEAYMAKHGVKPAAACKALKLAPYTYSNAKFRLKRLKKKSAIPPTPKRKKKSYELMTGMTPPSGKLALLLGSPEQIREFVGGLQ
jgi:hypothetical protein